MRHLLNRAAILLFVCAAASVAAFATTSSRKVTFNRDVTVNGTPVKAGTYKATFDDKTGVFTLLSGKTVVARAAARLEAHDDASGGEISTKNDGMGNTLISVDMSRSNRAVIVKDGDGKAMSTP